MPDEFGIDADTPSSDAGFFAAARNRVGSFLTPLTDFAASPAGGQLFNAIYEFGRGKIDAARERAVGAFMMTSEGRKFQAEGIRQTTNQFAPLIVVGVIVLLFAGALLSRR